MVKTNKGARVWRVLAMLAFAVTPVAPSAVAQEIYPVADFYANPPRQAPGKAIQFVDQSTPRDDLVKWRWEFGDSPDTPVDSTQQNPTHAYAAAGVYTVTLEVENRAGYTNSITRDVEIVELPFADFYGRPVAGAPPLTVNFYDTSQGANGAVAVAWRWDFGDDTPPLNRGPNVQHTYQAAGQYAVTLTVTFSNNTTATITKENYIDVAESQEPTATFDAASRVRDTEALLPLNDWVPLFSFRMGFGEPGYRYLKELVYTVTSDNIESEADRPYFTAHPHQYLGGHRNESGPDRVDILDFALFYDEPVVGTPDELDVEDDLLFTWDNQAVDGDGTPIGTVSGDEGPLRYELDFLPDDSGRTPTNPIHRIAAGPDDPNNGNHYIVAVRTSALWHSGMTMGVIVDYARMYNPFGETSDDSYPNDGWSEPVGEETGYSASFSVHDFTQYPYHNGVNHGDEWRFGNAWTYPRHYYTPLAEYSRPRWDLPGNLFEMFLGEMTNLRELFSVEAWTPLVGINMHGTHVLHWPDSKRPFDVPVISSSSAAGLVEVNMAFRDVGAKPGDPAGSGGFDPRSMLDPMTASVGPVSTEAGNYANGRDFAFNGVWVYHDTNGNGVFDPPAQNAGGGVFFDGAGAGDFPMWPGNLGTGSPDMTDPYKERWGFVGNPPDGGDPWWRMKIRLLGDRRRPEGAADPSGMLEATPDNLWAGVSTWYSEQTYDYFVVFRADSGFQDVSMLPGDGNGYQPGADFKAFVEPRWFDADQGHWQGGIYADSMIPYVGALSRDRVLTAWQDDDRWLLDEPFFPERTTDAMTAKAMRGGVEVHDYTILYDSDSQYAGYRDIYYPGGGPATFYPYANLEWSDWLDAEGTRNDRFYYGAYDAIDRRHLSTWYLHGTYSLFGTSILAADEIPFVFPFETTPFRSVTYDGNTSGPRSPVYVDPPTQPDLPTYDTWYPGNLGIGRYPSITDWAPNEVRARYLKQRIDIGSRPTPVLGINLVGTDDIFTNRANSRYLNDLYVAFWGPDFDPRTDLLPLDPAGGTGSGVQLRTDGDGDGSYNNPNGLPGVTVDFDPPVPLKELGWQKAPELVDLDGDGVADDLSGDGQVTDKDKAWVLRLLPIEKQLVPASDANAFKPATGGGGDGGGGDGGDGGDGGEKTLNPAVGMTDRGSMIIDAAHLSKPRPLSETTSPASLRDLTEHKALPLAQDLDAAAQASAEKVAVAAVPQATPAPKLVPADKLVGNPGDDLFITIQTSDKLKRFENFHAFIPATLPERERTLRSAGIHMEPTVVLHPQALQKVNPEEMAVEDYYRHDMVEVNVPVKLSDLTGAGQTITKDSTPFAAIGIDISTNRGSAGTATSGTGGTGGPGTFLVNGAGWVPNAYAGCFLIDSSYEAFEIISNTEVQLNLLGSFQPKNGRWFIAKDPTFLEQVIVELYQEGDDGQFNIVEDLAKLDKDDLTHSGVAIYRDADENPANRNGLFDPGIDVPLQLNDDPKLIGQVGEPETQVLFVFSSPGTDDLPRETPRAQQPHLRRWVPDSFPDAATDPFKGDDFFVVIKTSNSINVGDDFTVGIVSWGPDTPTQPDADTFLGPNVPMNASEDLSKYLEFPWGSRALGFITVFQQPPDDSGYNWIRTTAMRALKTKKITASATQGGGGNGGGGTGATVTISNVTPSVVSTTIPAGGTSLTITGKGFGTSPVLRLNGDSTNVQLSQAATDTQIIATIAGGTTFPEGPIIVQVQNPGTGATGSANNLLTAVAGRLPDAPVINTIDPASGTKDDFPVTILGKNFTQMPNLEVRFGGRKVPVASVDPQGTRIDVNFPPEDLLTGPLDVEVTSIHFLDGQKVSLKTVKPDGFFYSNPAGGVVQPCFIATAAYGTPFAQHLDSFRAFRDGVLLKSAAGTAVVDLYYSSSPAMADEVAAHPWLAALVRAVLTPVAWAIEQPAVAAAVLLAAAVAVVAGRRRRVKA